MASNELTARVLREEDLPALVQIDSMTSGLSRADYLRDKAARALETPHSTVIGVVAEGEGRVVGFMMGQVFKGSSA